MRGTTTDERFTVYYITDNYSVLSEHLDLCVGGKVADTHDEVTWGKEYICIYKMNMMNGAVRTMSPLRRSSV